MSKKSKNSGDIVVEVNGIRYEEFSKIKWQQFLKVYMVVVLLIVAVVIYSMISGATFSIPSIFVILLILAVMLLIFRSGIKSEYRKNKFSELSVTYSFNKDGWSVQKGKARNTIPWSGTYKMKRNQNALLIYPNKKSVNLIPLRCVSASDLEKIIGCCTGKK